MIEQEYVNAKRFIKRNWDSMSAEKQFAIAKEIGGIRHYLGFLLLMTSLNKDISEQELLHLELAGGQKL
jgi:hypothetical protein